MLAFGSLTSPIASCASAATGTDRGADIMIMKPARSLTSRSVTITARHT